MTLRLIIFIAAVIVAQTGFAQLFGPLQTISTLVDGPMCTHPADLDGDGDLDVLSVSRFDNKLAWYENLGTGLFGTQQIIATVNSLQFVFAADLDNDGKMDVLVARTFLPQIIWFKNLGGGQFGPQTTITTKASGGLCVHAADLDGDNDMDVISGSQLDKVAWYENLGGGSFGPQIVISTLADYVWSVYANDMDGDGDLDVLSGSFNDDEIAWYENLGSDQFGPQQIISSAAQSARDVFAADIDNDGDMDAISGAIGQTAWYENQGGGTFDHHFILESGFASLKLSVVAADLDEDGDMDVLASTLDNYTDLIWFENLGGGQFGPKQIITNDANRINTVHAADMDGDGDLDVLAGGEDSDKIVWFENLISDGCMDPGACNYKPVAWIDDGSCCYTNCGCTKLGACNFNPAATCDNGSCTFATTWYLDGDADGYYSSTQNACNTPGAGWSSSAGNGGGDCNNSNSAIHPGATEIVCNNIDDDCDGIVDEGRINGCTDSNACNYNTAATCNDGSCTFSTWYLDADADNYYSTIQSTCTTPGIGWSNSAGNGGGDCNDSNAAIHPGAIENVCNSIDDDCDGTVDEGRINGCTNATACNYNSAATCDNGSCTFALTWYLDADADNYYSSTQNVCTTPGVGWSNSAGNGGGDCNDSNASIHPGATEVCGNGADDDCDGIIDEGCCTLSASAIANNTSCANNTSGIIIATAINGTAPFTYSIDGITFSSNNTFTNLVEGVYTVTVRDVNACQATTTATVSQYTGPSAPTAIIGPAGACRNQTAVVFSVAPVAGATSYQWTLPTGATGSSTTNSISLTFSSTYNTGNLCVRAVNACGQSAQTCMSVLVLLAVPSTPGAISGGNVNACANTSKVYSIAPVSNATSYLWTAPPNATIASGQGTTEVTVSYGPTFGSGGVLSVRAVNCKGNSGIRSLTVYGKPVTPGVISGTASSVCAGSTQSYSIAAVNGATSYIWTVPVGAIINSGQGNTSISVTFPTAFSSGNITVAATSACGTSTVSSLAVKTGLALPASVTGQTSNLCGGGLFTYTIPVVSGAISYNWTPPAGCSITANTGTSVTLSIPGNFVSGNLCYTVTNICGTSAMRCNALTAMPAIPTITNGPANVCANATGLVFSTPQVSTYTYTWTLPAGCTITSGQGTNTVTVNWGASPGYIAVKAYNPCGGSSSFGVKYVTVVACMQSNNNGGEENNNNQFSDANTLKFDVYPNPNTGMFVVNSEFEGDFVIQDEMGRAVRTFRLSTANYRQMEVTGLDAGLYFVTGLCDGVVVTERVVVVK